MDWSKLKCGHCLWWDEHSGDSKKIGLCRRRAPVVERPFDLILRHGVSGESMTQIDNGPWGEWPWTRVDWWCGDHVPRGKVNK